MTTAAPTAPSQTPINPPADWYDDPSSPNALRYWDGSGWTNHLAPHPQVASVPVPVPPQMAAGPVAGVSRPKNSKATASLVLGIFGVFLIPIVFSLLAIIFAVSARSEIDSDPRMDNRGSATAGLWLGIVGLAGWALILISLGA